MIDIELKNFSVDIDGKAILKKFNFSASSGEFISIAGVNGAGKTTFLKALAGLVAMKGEYRLSKRKFHEITPEQKGKMIAYLPQYGIIPPYMTVQGIVSLGRLIYGDEKTQAAQAMIYEALRQTELLPLANQTAETLSGGQKSRLFLARTFVIEAPILLLDEPIVGLDPAQTLKMMALLKEKVEKERALIIIILHDLSLAARFCSRICLLKEGQIKIDAPPESAFSQENLKDVYQITARYVDGVPLPWSLS